MVIWGCITERQEAERMPCSSSLLGCIRHCFFVLKFWLLAFKTTVRILAESSGCGTEHTALNVTILSVHWSPVRG